MVETTFGEKFNTSYGTMQGSKSQQPSVEKNHTVVGRDHLADHELQRVIIRVDILILPGTGGNFKWKSTR